MKTVFKSINGVLFGMLVLTVFLMFCISSNADLCYDKCYEDPVCVGQNRKCRHCAGTGGLESCTYAVPQQIIYAAAIIESVQTSETPTGNRGVAGIMEVCYTTAWCGETNVEWFALCDYGGDSCIGTFPLPFNCLRCGTLGTPVKTPLRDWNCVACGG